MGKWLRKTTGRGRGRPRKNAAKPKSLTEIAVHEVESLPGTSRTCQENLVLGTTKTPSIRTRSNTKLVSTAGSSKQTNDEIYENNSQNVAPNQHDVSKSSERELEKDLFDQLFESDLQNDLTVNKTKIKTYTNKKKKNVEPESDDKILEFHDCKNRDNIIQWLNDNSNVFDRLTQTQITCENSEEDEIPMTLNVPSVSQVKTITKSTNTRRRGLRSSPKTRARSLDIHVTKNSKRGRLKRHSLAGDTPSIDDYTIEETYTDDDMPVQDAKVLLNLMEDEYLNTLENEIETKKEDQGWGRIKEIKETIKKTMKEPKKLNITFQTTQTKRDDEIQIFPTFSLSVVEDYLSTHIEKVEERKSDKITCCKVHNDSFGSSHIPSNEVNKLVAPPVGVSERSITIKTIDKAKELIALIKTLESKELNQLFPLFLSIKSFFEKKVDASIQTDSDYVDKATETDRISLREAGNQTFDFEFATLVNKESRETNDTRDDLSKFGNSKPIRVVLESSNLAIDDSVNTTNVNNEIELSNNLFNVTVNNELENVNGLALNIDAKSPVLDKSLEKVPEIDQESQKFDMDDDLFDDFNFDTEEMVKSFVKERSQKSEKNSVENEPEIVEIIEKESPGKAGSHLSCLVMSIQDLRKGIKRMRPPTPNDSDEGNSKRPCEKFIDEDLSIAFDSETPSFEIEPQKTKPPEEAVPFVGFENLANASTSAPAVKRSRTQEMIEECDLLIYEATKSNALKQEQRFSGISSDGFAANSLFLDEENISKMEKDINEAMASTIIPETEAFEVPSKSSRRSLFSNDSKRNSEKLSESIFTDEINNVTITEKNVNDVALKNLATKIVTSDNEIDEEIAAITSTVKTIKVLQNVVLRRSEYRSEDLDDENKSSTSDDTLLSDVDVVETTPQKAFPSFNDQRGHLLDITLPPPLQFQDSESANENRCNDVTMLETAIRTPIRPRSPLARILNHSTPRSQKPASEKTLSLSPIEKKTLGLYDQVQQSEFSPLMIVSNKSQRSAQKSSKQKSILNYVSQSSQESSQSSTKPTKPCVACTRISKDQVIAISSLTNKKLATYSTSFSSKVTHLIVSVNEQNCIKDHTIKFVSAVAAGIWVLSFRWVQECLNKHQIVPEELYEALDVSGIDGPRQSRLNRTKNPLFKGYKMYAAAPFLSTTQKDVENIIKLLGGKAVARAEELLDDDSSIRVIITEARATQDFNLYETWLEVFRVVTVDIEWLSRSVGQYKILSLRPFTLCSDDSIANLGYPPELLITVPFSSTENT